MGMLDLMRALPRGTRVPGPSVSERAENLAPSTYMPFMPLSTKTGAPAYYYDDDGLVLGIPAAWRCMNIIAGLIAQMNLRVVDRETEVVIAKADTPQVMTRPWPMVSYFDWMFSAICSAVLHGNFIAIKYDHDADLRPRQLIPLHPDDVIMRVEDGVPKYDILPLNNREFDWQQVFHVRGFTLPGSLWGIGVIDAHRRNLLDTRGLMNYGAQAYTGGAVPPVVIQVDKPELSEGEAEYLQTRWIERHGSGHRIPAVVPKILTITPIGLSMGDAEYLESRKFSVAEISFMFNLSPEDLSTSMGGPGLTYSNIESKTRERLLYSLQPWMSRFEQSFDDILPGSQGGRFDIYEILRGDELTRMKTYAIGLETGAYTLNEVRRREHLTEYGTWADKPFSQPPWVLEQQQAAQQPRGGLAPGHRQTIGKRLMNDEEAGPSGSRFSQTTTGPTVEQTQ